MENQNVPEIQPVYQPPVQPGYPQSGQPGYQPSGYSQPGQPVYQSSGYNQSGQPVYQPSGYNQSGQPNFQSGPVYQPVPPVEPVYQPVPTPPAKNRKPLIIGIAAAALVVIIVLVSILAGGSGAAETAAIAARLNEDSCAYIAVPGSDTITINDEVSEASITGDRQHVVVLLTDGTLYVTDGEQNEKTHIADNATDMYSLRNDGFLYKDEDEVIWRVTFADQEVLELGSDIAVAVAKNTISLVYATQEGNNVYTLAANSSESTKVGTWNDYVTVEAVSDDGQLAVWVSRDGSTDWTIYSSDGDNRTKLGEFTGKYNYTDVTFTKDQGMLVVTNTYCDRLWIITPGNDPVRANLNAEFTGTVYTNQLPLVDAETKDVTALYVGVDAGDYMNVYSVSLDGDRERVLSDVSSFRVFNGNMFYSDDNGTLYYGALKGTEVEDETKISGDIGAFSVADGGEYVYYIKNPDSEEGTSTLYCYKVGQKDPVRVSSGVYGTSGMYVKVSDDGSTVFYYKDVETIPSTYTSIGTLMMWHYGDDSATRIASDVILYSMNSGLESTNLDPNSFSFLKYSAVTDDGKEQIILADWMYYDGKDDSRITGDVIYSKGNSKK